jgi:putative tryptophan/tyrosine transport system substrate-binding protein
MRRREFITLISCAAAMWPLAASAQKSDRTRKIAVLMGTAATGQGETYLAAFFRRLEEQGWTQGRNISINVRWWAGGPEQMRIAGSELLAPSPDVVITFSNLALDLLKPMAGRVPIVFAGVGDPLGAGYVASLARPGGNITGFVSFDGPMGGKWLEVLKETAPQLRRVMAILHSDSRAHQAFWHSIKEAAPRLGVEVIQGAVHDAAGIDGAISSFAMQEHGGVIVLPSAIARANENLIIALGQRHRLPAIYPSEGSVAAGGLVSYGVDYRDNFRKAAEYVDRILRGEKPGDLPVQQPTKFKLAFNLKTAKTIGLEIPAILLARADEVIE